MLATHALLNHRYMMNGAYRMAAVVPCPRAITKAMKTGRTDLGAPETQARSNQRCLAEIEDRWSSAHATIDRQSSTQLRRIGSQDCRQFQAVLGIERARLQYGESRSQPRHRYEVGRRHTKNPAHPGFTSGWKLSDRQARQRLHRDTACLLSSQRLHETPWRHPPRSAFGRPSPRHRGHTR